jgi:serine/threonine-protein kinase RsbW
MKKTFKRSFDSLERIFAFTERFFAREEIEESHRFAVNLAVEELFTNMVKYNADSPSEIAVQMIRRDDRLEVSVSDLEAHPFDVTRVDEARVDLPLEQRRPGGLGLHLVKKMMDDIDYDWSNGRSTITVTRMLR